MATRAGQPHSLGLVGGGRLSSGRAGLRAGGPARLDLRPGKNSVRIWWALAALLVFLGINKRLNLQPFLIVMGRRAAVAGGWYEHRRLAQAVFSAVFVLAASVAVFLLGWQVHAFFTEHPLAWRGLIVLVVFVLIRASTINHIDEGLGVNLYDNQWCWLLEICGSFLLGLSAFHSIQSQRHE